MPKAKFLVIVGAMAAVAATVLFYPTGPSKEEVACLTKARASEDGAALACETAAADGSSVAGYVVAAMNPAAPIPEAAAEVAPAKTERALVVLRRVDTSREGRDAAVADLRVAAGEGYAPAQRWLAVVLLAGELGEDHEGEAADWLEKAALQGSADAQFLLAGMFRTGTGVTTDRQRMRDLYLEAAQRGHAAAAYNLSADYYDRGKPDDAFLWLKRSAAGGFAPAHVALAKAAKAAGPKFTFASAVHFQLAAEFSEGEVRVSHNDAAAVLVAKLGREQQRQVTDRVGELAAAIRGDEELDTP